MFKNNQGEDLPVRFRQTASSEKKRVTHPQAKHHPRHLLGSARHSLPADRSASQDHRITGWKRPLRSSSPTICPTPPRLLNHGLKYRIYTFFEPLQ